MGIRLRNSRSEQQVHDDFLELEREHYHPSFGFPVIIQIQLRDHVSNMRKLLCKDVILMISYSNDHMDVSLDPPDGIRNAKLMFLEIEDDHASDSTMVLHIINVVLDFLAKPSPDPSPVNLISPPATTGIGSFTTGIDETLGETSSDSEEVNYSRLKSAFSGKMVIGLGSFGTVYKVTSKIDGSDYAVKVIEKGCDPSKREDAFREAKCLALLKHDNVVSYYGAWTDHKSNLCILMELCSSTLEFWATHCPMDVPVIFRQLIAGLSHIHHPSRFITSGYFDGEWCS
ncbi:Myosin-IIIb [Orobanche hederae]